MESAGRDEAIEISSRNYQKLSKSLQKEGFREGKSTAADKHFQSSFDNGYADGFKIGFLLGKSRREQAKLGHCELCRDGTLLTSDRSELDVRKIVGRRYEEELKAGT